VFGKSALVMASRAAPAGVMVATEGEMGALCHIKSGMLNGIWEYIRE